jgi:hypothetical protein
MATETRVEATYGRQFVVVFPDSMLEIARDRTASSACMPVLAWGLANMGFERWTMLAQERVGDELGFGQATVGKALRDLLERGFLERRGSGPRQEWRLTPKAAWMGTASSYQKARRTRLAVVPAVAGPANDE